MNPKAGWYRDPSGRAWSRFWDGDRWREWIDGTEDYQDPIGERDLEPPGADAHRLTLTAAHPPPDFIGSIPVPVPESDGGEVGRGPSALTTGCALGVLWIGGGALTLWIALAVAIGPFPCEDVGFERECGGSSPLPVLALGFGLIVLSTVLIVVRLVGRRGTTAETATWFAISGLATMAFGVGMIAIVTASNPDTTDFWLLTTLVAVVAVPCGAVLALVGLIVLTGSLIRDKGPSTDLTRRHLAAIAVLGWTALAILAAVVAVALGFADY